MSMVLPALAGGSAFVAWAALWYLTAYLRRRQVVDVPNARSSHKLPTPRGGGLVIVAVTLTGWLAFGLVTAPDLWFGVLTCGAGAALVAVVSWLDDLQSLSNRVRFSAHSLAAVLAMVGLGYWPVVTLPWLGTVELGWLGLPLTFVWIVGLTNAYNFMDGIDGIAGVQAVAAGLGWAGLGAWASQPLTCALGILLAGSNLGFLGHNWPPARIFMGDVGSAFIGYLLAILPLLFTWCSDDPTISAMGLVTGALCVWPFIMDTSFTLLRRLCKGENIFMAHRSHLYQRLHLSGYQHRFVTLLYLALAVVGVVLAHWWMRQRDNVVDIIVALTLALLCLALWGFVVRQEQKQMHSAADGAVPTT